jgi:hypothetical protein
MTDKLLSHKAVNYRATVFDKHRCGTCSMYIRAKGSKGVGCTLVERPIRPHCICDRWVGKENKEKEHV